MVDLAAIQMPDTLVVGVASIEFAVHGWNIAQAIGPGTTMSDGLEAALLPISHVLVPTGARNGLFALP
jgi:hypothetical protein